jgi:predicted deacylase
MHEDTIKWLTKQKFSGINMPNAGEQTWLRIGNVTSQPGAKLSGHLKLVDKAASSINIPITIIQGPNPGPTLVVIAGEHGCEYCGIMAAIRVIRDTQPENINGTLVVVPVANPPAFEERTLFVNPIDAVNLYASYPGSPDGTVSYIMAYKIFNEVVLKADYLVSLHGADYNESLIPFSYYARTGNTKVDSMSQKLASSFPVDYVLEAIVASDVSTGSPKGTSYAATATGTLYGEASSRGIPSTMCESGGEGKIEEDYVHIHYDGIMNVLKLLGMISGMPNLKKQTKLYSPVLVSNKSAGLFNPLVSIGERVKEGQQIGEIMNLQGDIIETILSPIEGLVVDRINFAAVDAFPTQKQPYLFYIAKTD